MDINYIAPINFLGYGCVGINLLKALSKNNKVSAWIIGQAEAHPREHELIKQTLHNAVYFNNHAPSLRVWHQFDMSMHVGKGLHTGLPIFELNKFNEVELHHLKTLDHIFVPSQWAKNIVEENNVGVPTTVAPFGVDTEIFKPIDCPLNQNVTTFLNIGKWEIRKGHDFLLEAFNAAFEPTDNVALIMNCHNPFLLTQSEDGNKQWESLYKNSKLGDKITIIPHRLETQEDVAILMNSVDCGVFPARAEGWNLELLEMMACGKILIATDYSAHTEFIDDACCHKIRINNLESAYDGKWFHGIGEWAALEENELEQLIYAMRHLHKWKQEGGDMCNKRGVEKAKLFSWDNTADKIVGVLSERNRN